MGNSKISGENCGDSAKTATKSLDGRVLVQFSTITGLLPLWMKNMARNMDTILSSKDLRDLKPENRPAIVIGAGPSVRELGHLKMLRDSKFDGVLIATDRMLVPCLEAGIVPDYVCCVDGDETVVPGFFAHELVWKLPSACTTPQKVKGLFSTFVNRKVFDHWKGESYFFINSLDDLNNPTSLTRALHYMTKNTITPGVGDVGGMSWQLAHGLGCNPIILIGMDYSEKRLEDLPDYQSYIKQVHPKHQEVKKFFHRHYNTFFKNFCHSGLLFETCWETLRGRFELLHPHGQRTINCTGGGLIQGPHVECMHFQDFLKKYEEGGYAAYKAADNSGDRA